METEILTIKEVAGFLRVTEMTVWRWLKAGKLTGFQVGRGWRVRKSDLERFVKKQIDDHRSKI